MPLGSSPIFALGWAPTGLKYRSKMVLKGCFPDFKICSPRDFVCPYGFKGVPRGVSSVTHSSDVSPYTVALDEKIKLLHRFGGNLPEGI